MIGLLALVAFSWLPVSHRPHNQGAPVSQLDRPFFVGEMTRLVPQEHLAFQPRETAMPVLDEAQSRMYLGTSDGNVRCRFHGNIAWSWKAKGSILASPLLEGESLYVASADGKLTALNRITGEVRWSLDVHEELTTTPTFSDGRLFVMSSEESITAVDAKEGKSLWKFHRDPPGGFTIRGNARPIVAHGSVFVGFADGTVAALKPEDGVARWVKELGKGDYTDVDDLAAPDDDGHVYAASARVGVVALDAATGDQSWTFSLPGANHLLVDGSRVLASGKGGLVAIDRAAGSELWRLKLRGEKFATQAAARGGLVLVSEDRGPLYALDAASGVARAVFDPGSGFSQGATLVPGAAFIVSNGGVLFSLGLLP